MHRMSPRAASAVVILAWAGLTLHCAGSSPSSPNNPNGSADTGTAVDGGSAADAVAVQADAGPSDVGGQPDTGALDVPLDDTADSAADIGVDASADVGTPDGSMEGGSVDGGTPDAGNTDSGATDAGPLDAGVDVCTGTVCGTTCVDTASDPHNCGRCGHDCTGLPGVAPSVQCVAGACSVGAACLPGRGHCATDPEGGCETDLTTTAHCGGCTAACAEPTPLCAGGVDGGVATCVSGCAGAMPTRCSMACTNTQSDAANCGACGHACTAPSGGSATCALGSCSAVCPGGAHVCGTACAGNTAVATCGGSCTPCPPRANAVATCDGTACGFTCTTGYGDCDGNPANGCESTLASDPANCGGCGMPCTAGTCLAGACVPLGTMANPALSCADLHTRNPSAANGTYWVSPDGTSPLQVLCEMTIDGGGWTQARSGWVTRLPTSGATYRYLYLDGTRWYESPTTSLVWSWTTGQQLTGTYAYSNGTGTGTVTCTGSGEQPTGFGVGCSNGGGHTPKVLPYYADDPTNGRCTVCQDVPDAFGVGACTPTNAVTIYVR